MDSGERGRVLVVDDDEDLRFMYREALQVRGFAIDLAEDAFAATRYLAARVPDAVILDMAMARKSGLAVLKEIREQERTKHLPVVVVSAIDPSNELFAGQNWGWDRYLQKPIALDRLEEVLQELIERPKPVRKSLELEDSRPRERISGKPADGDARS